MSSPKARIAMRPELAKSGWLDTMTGKSLRKIGRDSQGEQHKEVCFWLFLSRGFPPAGVSSRAPNTQQLHLRHAPLIFVLQTYRTWSRRQEVPSESPKC
jgi:hypothetical protein